MSIKIKAFFLYGFINFFVLLFIMFNPDLVFDTTLEKVKLINPQIIIGNNGRIVSFVDTNQKKEFNSLCVKAKSNNISICDYRENMKKIEVVLGCYPTTFLSKNKFNNNFIIQKIEFIDNSGKKQVFEISDFCIHENKENRILFYIFYFVINISLFFYLFQFRKKDEIIERWGGYKYSSYACEKPNKKQLLIRSF